MKKNGSINLLIIAGIFIAFVLGCNQKADKQRAERKEVNEKLNAAAPDPAKLPPKERLSDDPYIKGKIVVVRRNENGKPRVSNMDGGQFGDAYARAPEEVETVALVECLRKPAGAYRTKTRRASCRRFRTIAI